MESQHLLQRAEVSYGAYTAIPRSNEWKEICVVKDKITDETTGIVTGESGWKLVGGKVEPGETLNGAAGKEIDEEVHLRMLDPRKIILVVHKTSRDPGSKYHHAVFFEAVGAPHTPVLIPGPEIARAEWMSWETIRRMIWNREVVPQHAAAILWLFTRKAYFEGNERILGDILSLFHHYRSYNIGQDGILTICLDNTCEECEPRKFEVQYTAPAVRNYRPATRVAAPVPREAMEPTPVPEKKLAEGNVDIVFVCSTRMEDFVLLGQGQGSWKFGLPQNHSSSLAQKIKAWTGSDMFAVVRERPGLVLVECARPVRGFEAVSLNDGENGLLSYEDRRTIADALATWSGSEVAHWSWRSPKRRPIPDKYLETMATRD